MPSNGLALARIVGKDLVGAKGATPRDQLKIDKTAVGLCAAGLWGREDCVRHGEGR